MGKFDLAAKSEKVNAVFSLGNKIEETKKTDKIIEVERLLVDRFEKVIAKQNDLSDKTVHLNQMIASLAPILEKMTVTINNQAERIISLEKLLTTKSFTRIETTAKENTKEATEEKIDYNINSEKWLPLRKHIYHLCDSKGNAIEITSGDQFTEVFKAANKPPLMVGYKSVNVLTPILWSQINSRQIQNSQEGESKDYIFPESKPIPAIPPVPKVTTGSGEVTNNTNTLEQWAGIVKTSPELLQEVTVGLKALDKGTVLDEDDWNKIIGHLKIKYASKEFQRYLLGFIGKK